MFGPSSFASEQSFPRPIPEPAPVCLPVHSTLIAHTAHPAHHRKVRGACSSDEKDVQPQCRDGSCVFSRCRHPTSAARSCRWGLVNGVPHGGRMCMAEPSPTQNCKCPHVSAITPFRSSPVLATVALGFPFPVGTPSQAPGLVS